MSMIPGYFLFNEIPSLRTLLGVICIISAGFIFTLEKAFENSTLHLKFQLEDKLINYPNIIKF